MTSLLMYSVEVGNSLIGSLLINSVDEGNSILFIKVRGFHVVIGNNLTSASVKDSL